MKAMNAIHNNKYTSVIKKLMDSGARKGTSIVLWMEGKRFQSTLIKNLENIKNPKIRIFKTYKEYKRYLATVSPLYMNGGVKIFVFAYPSEWEEWDQLTGELVHNNKQVIYMIDNSLKASCWADQIKKINKSGTELVPVNNCFM